MSLMIEGLMKNLTSGDNLSLIGKKVGADDKSVKSTLEMGLPLLLGALNTKASKPEGMSAIMNSVSQASSSNPLENIVGLLGGSGSAQGSDMLSSLLGSNVAPIQQALSGKTGLSSGITGKILTMAMPLLMNVLSKKMGSSMGTEGLSTLLGEESKMALSASPAAAGLIKDLSASEKSTGGLWERIKKMFG